ncbi:gamma-glutamyltransferase [Pleionea litopenaei]|uniref:Glutathione hydrolase proenzyme n=1 Tax=Pleionea litopenaei TaxID=3070815 RepID=A0AA51RUF9_9GAMM|nr:gamma-glutamyltransferase [Pleionea sp. HL-JVS1]WMS87709.1 gamma-glutamyltransferase [Pleionea sp. HL-JVS1]
MILKSTLRFFIALCCVNAIANDALIEWESIHQPIRSDGGMVASQEFRASKVAADILAQGGNAIDAAVALGFAEAVTLPKAGNIGGGGFMLIYLAKEDRFIAIDYREMAPSKASASMFLDENGNVDKNSARYSTKSSGVPGTVAGLLHALENYGSFKREQVLQPAIDLAKDGITADYPFLDSLEARKTRLIQDPEVARWYFKPDGMSYRPGEIMRFTDLAETLERVKLKGADGFYKGKTAQLFETYMKNNNGFIAASDMANYQAKERPVIRGTYRGYDVVSMPPPSSGGVHIIQALNILENFSFDDVQWGSSQHIHLLTETFKRIYADRSKHLGDPDFIAVPVEQLINKDYAKQLAKSISLEKATPSENILPSKFQIKESNQTTHFSVIDRWGNIVTNTYTLNFSFGSGKIVPGTGVFLNNEMDDFSAKPGSPNAYGLLGGKANAIEANKRPLSSMTPTIILKNKRPVLVTGSPGGSRIITTVLHQIVNVIDFGMNIADAANMPRFHHQWYPDKIFIEPGFGAEVLLRLKQLGHTMSNSRVSGSVQSVAKNEKGEALGASDPRRQGAKTIGVMQSGQMIEH